MLSIIIINYNTKIMTQKCIDSVCMNLPDSFEYEIIVVDNSSDDRQIFEKNGAVKVVRTQNRGFGDACNVGAAASSGDVLLMLNSDIIIKDASMVSAYEYITKRLDCGILGGKLLLPDGKMDHGCRRGFPTPKASFYYMFGFDKRHPNSPKYGGYRLNYLSENEVHDVDCVSGAYMMIKTELYKRLNGFDTDYFMYGEDIDICWRAKKLGENVVFYPKATAIHYKGQSGLHTKSKTVLKYFYDSMKIFYKKNMAKDYNPFVNGLVYTGIFAKKCLSLMLASLGGGK